MILAVLALAVGTITVPPAPSPWGLWKTPVEDGLIRVERCGDALCGYVAGSTILRKSPGQTDVRNPAPALRSRPVMGLLMMKLKPSRPGHWGPGWIYDPRNGGTFTARLEMAFDGRLRLTGCIAPILCETQTWTRAG